MAENELNILQSETVQQKASCIYTVKGVVCIGLLNPRRAGGLCFPCRAGGGARPLSNSAPGLRSDTR